MGGSSTSGPLPRVRRCYALLVAVVRECTSFLAAYDIDVPEKKAQLLTLCGVQVYETACVLVHPKIAATASYDENVAALTAYLGPRPSEVYNRTLLHRWDKLLGKSVSSYAAAIQKLAADCNFGTPDPTNRLYKNSTMLPLDVTMQDRFLCDLRDAHSKQRLFAKPDLNCKTEYDIAFRYEGAVKQE